MNNRTSPLFPRYRYALLCCVAVVCLAVAAKAQGNIKPVFCGNELFSSMVEKQYPALQASFEATFEDAKHHQHSRSNEPLTIPVIVHIVWNAPEENLDDSIIYNQLDILNADFNRLNADTQDLREVYHPVAASANIHFELVQIIRTHTDVLFSVDLLENNLLPEVKHTALGGSDAWNPDEYMNIWICKIQPIEIFGIEVGQILGFSFPPNNLPHWPPDVGAPNPDEDGVVIDFRVFGSNNPNPINNPVDLSPLTVKGRTPVHEVGHYLGLRHIWGDGGTFGPNDCAQSDGIDDTPFANAQSNFDCDKSKNTCNVVEDYYDQDMPDLVENYMDYASEDCMNMFTQGQVDLMRGILAGPRLELVNEVSATSGIAANDAFTISPNPATDVIRISSASRDFGIHTVTLLSADGKVLAHEENIFPADHFMIRVPSVQPGFYYIRVNAGERVGVKKIVIGNQ